MDRLVGYLRVWVFTSRVSNGPTLHLPKYNRSFRDCHRGLPQRALLEVETSALVTSFGTG